MSAVINIDQMLEKRREVVGDARRFKASFRGKEFWFVAPELASQEFNDELNALREDARGGLITTEMMREDLVAMMLGDQSEEFTEECIEEDVDPLTIVEYVMQEHADTVGKNRSQRRSRNIPKR